jgi:GNAT superfamily N-acetyltransferase
MSEYTFGIELFHENYPEIEHLYKEHYAEMTDRLSANGFPCSPYNPRLDEYFKASVGGWLINYICRLDGVAVGYCNIYITHDMHNCDLIAQEDTVFITKEHRNGQGRKLIKFVLSNLRDRSVKKFNVNAMTDLRATKLWERMGFRHTCHSMTYIF